MPILVPWLTGVKSLPCVG